MLFLGKQRETRAVLAEGAAARLRLWFVEELQGSMEHLCSCLYLLLDQEKENIFYSY